MVLKETVFILSIMFLPLLIKANRPAKNGAVSEDVSQELLGVLRKRAALEHIVKEIQEVLKTNKFKKRHKRRILKLCDKLSAKSVCGVGESEIKKAAATVKALVRRQKPKNFKNIKGDVLEKLQELSMKIKICGAIDGGYTDWSSWGPCSVSCDKGTQRRSRTCTNPPPFAGGKTCVERTLGPAEETQECETRKCPCPSSWTRNGQFCFYINVARFQDRAKVQQICSSLGANLPIIRNSGERDFIFNLLKNKAGLSGQGVWLGLNRHGSSFRWYDGTFAGYQTWSDGEPNNHGGNENCAQMYKGGGFPGKWNDHPCSGYAAAPSALCQKKVA